MIVNHKRAALLAITVGIALAGWGCRQEHASVEELYTTRMLGLSYLQRNQLTEAESSFKQLTKLAPDDPLGYANLGLTYLQAGRLDDAEKQLKRARELDPKNADIGLALAKVYSLTKRPQDARELLETLRRDSTANLHVLYALAELEGQSRDSAATRRYMDRLREVLAAAPSNIAVRAQLLNALVGTGQADSAVHQLEEIRRIPPELPREARTYLDSAIQLLRAKQVAAARPVVGRFTGAIEVTSPYQAALEDVKWTEGPIAGRPVLTFAPKYFVSLNRVRDKATVDQAKFVDATDEAGLRAGPGSTTPAQPATAALAVGDVDGDGTDDLFVSTAAGPGGAASAHLYRVQGGFVRDATERSGIALASGASYATFADYDNDGWLDLFAIGGDGKGHLFHNRGNGTFEDLTAKAGIGDVKGARKGAFVDLDHDGDLDLLLVGGGTPTIYRNNLDGTFTDATASFGISGSSAASDAVFADFDGDGRTDVVVVGSGGVQLFHNGGAQRFNDATAAAGLSAANNDVVATVGDYNNDGFLDLFIAGKSGGESALWLNKGDGTFSRDARTSVLQALKSISVETATFLDFDNDGWVDLLVGGVASSGATSSPSVFLFRNDGTGKFVDRSSVLPANLRSGGALSVAASDVDDDGDLDLWLVDAAGFPHLLRNDGGNSNLAVNIELKALRTGSGKNNAFGIGSRLNLRAGNIYQTRVATSRVTHFGLGPHLKADVLRIEWPNGVPQTIYFPGSDQDVVEREMLKGSCALAYAWDGKEYRFVTDAMWRSALGMPLGLMGGNSAFAPAGASQEYVRIAGDALQPRDGKYFLQLTEELWETAYADQVKLVAVDHPDSVDVFVDERFVPPGPVKLRLHEISQRSAPVSATDERGNDVLPALLKTDDIYVSNLRPQKYQGAVESHDLILDLGRDAGMPGTHLFLRGWIYPTDASINVALSQQSGISLAPPSLETRDASGKWKTALASIGFPSGKDKTLVVDLAGIFPTADHHVRLRTSMQIYWDQAFVARTLEQPTTRVTELEPTSANLHYRGFSRMYRKGGRYGPYWFDYATVTKDSPWRPIEGKFTRFGDILGLLRKADDMYVIMGPGDEATVQFDAASARNLPAGWKRDFLLYTDGWIKDSDLNTAFGTTVGPLPFHAIKSYPYAAGDAYPTDAEHERYQREYNTRVVDKRLSTLK
ncbi:MAG TPA: FG-GAP-like repeat-containing protein [Gemmatimonadaceae bacterium]|nr:FG-GAP-like repeat-containing protein [Gemmatimonadaceae bacterium]